MRWWFEVRGFQRASTVTNDCIARSPSTASNSSAGPPVTPASAGAGAATRATSRKGGIIFPSVKNKPIIGNNTFASEIVANYKDVKVSRRYINSYLLLLLMGSS